MSKKRDSMINNNNMNLLRIQPLTDNQERVFDYWDENNHLIITGYAGTGKTFIALFLALEAIEEKNNLKKIILVRSAVPTRDMGYLPGKQDEKAAAYEEPYETIVNDLYSRGDAYRILKRFGKIEFRTTSYMRGTTYDQSIIIVDEAQNLTMHEIDTICTRMGEDSRIIFCGDYRQTDLIKESDKKGFNKALEIFKKMPDVKIVEMTADDIVRSEFVKNWVLISEQHK